MNARRITVTIDRLVSDRPGLTREALADALSAEMHAQVAAHGAGALGAGRALARTAGRVAESDGKGRFASAVARATLRAVKP